MILFFRGKVLCPWTEAEKTFKEHFILTGLVDTLITATIPSAMSEDTGPYKTQRNHLRQP